jgi:hypothetical protein
MAGGTGKIFHVMRGAVGTLAEIDWKTLTGAAGPAPETPGTAVELVASLSEDAHFIKIYAENSILTGSDTSMLLDILTDTGGGDVVKVPNLAAGFVFGAMGSGGTRNPRVWGLPLYIPSGAQVLARIKTKLASDTVRCAIDFYGQMAGPQPADSIDTMGVDGPNATGVQLTSGTAHSWPATWTVIDSSTDNAYKALAISVGTHAAATNGLGQIEIGAGALASEVTIVPQIPYSHDANEGFGGLPDAGVFPLENELPAGSRLVARNRTNATADTNLRLLVHGIK